MSQRNVEIVRQIYERWGRGDFRAGTELYDFFSSEARALTSLLACGCASPQDMVASALTSQRSTEARVPGVSDESI